MSEKIDEKVVKKRNYMVDLCRFIAALMIMLCHLDLIGLDQYPTYMFVDFFFILSGYFTLSHFAKMKSAKKADERGRHNCLHLIVAACAKGPAHEHARTDTCSKRHADEDIRQGRTGTDCSKRRRADILPDDDGIGHVINLLKKTADDHRQCKNGQRLQRRIGD